MAALIRAAGGVVWRQAGAGGLEVCLVHRPLYDDWSLPKGKLHPGEAALAAAVREVREETGVRAVPRMRLATVRYRVGGRPKEVDYWAMRATEVAAFEPNTEVDQIAWVPAAGAADRVAYPHDARLLRDWAALPPVTGVVLLVRHAEAVPAEEWSGSDHSRPLTTRGRADAAELCRLLALHAPSRLVSASPDRCRESVAPLAAAHGLPIIVERCFDNRVADSAAVAARIRELTGAGATTVVCSQGEVIPGVLAELTGTGPEGGRSGAGAAGEGPERWETAKGGGWLLPFTGAAPLAPAALS